MPKPDRHPHPELVEVRHSKISGYGVFAIAPIPKGTRILEYTGEVITQEEADEREHADRVLLFDMGNGKVIDGDPMAIAANINHSCDPNAHSEVIRGHLYVIADRDIAPGEEIAYDYMFDPDAEIYLCACGTAKCRGTINVIRPRPAVEDSPWDSTEHKVVKANEGDSGNSKGSKKRKKAA